MSQSTAKATGRRTPQTKGKQVPAAAAAAAAPVDGSMVVSINMMDRGTVEEYLEAPKVVVASPKDTKSTTTKNSGDKTNGGITKEEQKASSTESHQNGSSTSEKKGENGVGGEKAAAPEVTNGEGKIRESPRQKAQKENEKKAAQMEQNETKKLEAEKKIIDQKSEQQQKSPEQKAEKKSDKVELNASTVSTASLAKEKELKGFHEDGSEAVSIVLKKDDVGSGAATFDSPRPNKTPGKGLKAGTTPNRARISPFRKSERLQNVSTAVNLSTVSEQSNEVAQSPNVDQSFGSLRHISGRRSFTNRPVREYTFQNFQRESYRKLPDGYDDSISSVNATVGSDLHNDSFRTPIVASVKGRKRELTPQDSDDDIRIVDKTPGKSKRPRLDLSAFLGFMASPVTLLRNKFQKANIQSSTPNQSFSVEELDKEATNGEKEKEMDVSDPKDKSMEEDELKKSIDMGQDVLLTDDMELLKEKHEDAEMKTTSLQVRRVCNVM